MSLDDYINDYDEESEGPEEPILPKDATRQEVEALPASTMPRLAAPPMLPQQLEAIKALPTGDKKRIVSEMLFQGMTIAQAAQVVGLTRAAVYSWFRADTDGMKEAMREAQHRRALLEMPKSFEKLVRLRDWSKNDEVARKAVGDLLALAGVPLASPPTTFTFNAQNIQINTVTELDKKLAEIAGRLGPEFVKLVQAEGVAVGTGSKAGTDREAKRPGSSGATTEGTAKA